MLTVWEQDYTYNATETAVYLDINYVHVTEASCAGMSNVQVVSRGHTQNFRCLPCCIGTSFTHIA